jgi:hypothetical protein
MGAIYNRADVRIEPLDFFSFGRLHSKVIMDDAHGIGILGSFSLH